MKINNTKCQDIWSWGIAKKKKHTFILCVRIWLTYVFEPRYPGYWMSPYFAVQTDPSFQTYRCILGFFRPFWWSWKETKLIGNVLLKMPCFEIEDHWNILFLSLDKSANKKKPTIANFGDNRSAMRRKSWSPKFFSRI